MSIQFSNTLPEHLQYFDMPLGEALEASGVLREEQVVESGNVQAAMIAVRNALEGEDIEREAVVEALGEFRENIDFLSLAKMDAKARDTALEKIGITDSDREHAADIVSKARTNKDNVNEGHTINVPPIGQIHPALYQNKIENFNDIKEGMLLVQRAIEISASAERIKSGIPSGGSKRGHKVFDNDSENLRNSVRAAEELHILETQYNYAIDNGDLTELAKCKKVIADHEGGISDQINEIIDVAENHFWKAEQLGLMYDLRDLRKSLTGLGHDYKPPAIEPVVIGPPQEPA